MLSTLTVALATASATGDGLEASPEAPSPPTGPQEHAGPASLDYRCEGTTEHAQIATPVEIGDCLFTLVPYETGPERTVWEWSILPLAPVDGPVGVRPGGELGARSLGMDLDVPARTPVRLTVSVQWCGWNPGVFSTFDCVPREDIRSVTLDAELSARERDVEEFVEPADSKGTPSADGLAYGSIDALLAGKGPGVVDPDDRAHVRVELAPTDHVELSISMDTRRGWDGRGVTIDFPTAAERLDADLPGGHLVATGLPSRLSASWASGSLTLRHDSPTLSGWARGTFGKVTFDRLPTTARFDHDWRVRHEDCSDQYERKDFIRVNVQGAPWGASFHWTSSLDDRFTDDGLDAEVVVGNLESGELEIDTGQSAHTGDLRFVNQIGSIDVDVQGTHFAPWKCESVQMSIQLDGHGLGRARLSFDKDARPVIEVGANEAPNGRFITDVHLDFLELFDHEPTLTVGIDREAWQCDPPSPYRVVVPATLDACLSEGNCRDWWLGVHMGRFCALGGG